MTIRRCVRDGESEGVKPCHCTDRCEIHDPRPEPSRELRELRLWHWRQVGKNRALARNAIDANGLRAYNAAADRHLSFVQTLNDFFPAGDNAEADDGIMRAAGV